jgi:glycosyltransferase involved in cell wall biosynthesis
MSDKEKIPQLSIIIPAYNESPNLCELIPVLTDVLVKTGREYEVILIDDGSTDNTVEVCCGMMEADPHIKMVEMLSNSGKSNALNVGFHLAKGDIVITMDGDLQDDPLEIPRFIEKIESGYDMVTGWKKVRKDPLEKTLPSRLFNKVTSKMVGLNLHDYNCGFKAYKRNVLKGLRLYGDLHRFIPALVFKQGYKVAEIPIEHHPRIHGKSKYGIERYLRGFLDLTTILFLTNFRTRPLHLIGGFGLLFLGVGGIIDLYMTILWFMGDRPIGNRPLLMLGTVMIVVGVQTFLYGLMSEMQLSLLANQGDVLSRVRQVVTHENLD